MPQRYLPPAESRFLGKLRNSVSSRRAPREQQAHKDQVQPTCPRRRTQIYEGSGPNDRAPIKQGRSRALGLHPVPRPNDPLEPSTIVLLEQFFGFAQRALLVDAWVRHPLKSIRLDKVGAIRRHYRDVALAWQGGAGVPPYEQGAGTVVAVDIERFGNPQTIYVMLTIPDDTAVPGVGVVHLEDAGLALHERRDAGAEPTISPNNMCRWRRASRSPIRRTDRLRKLRRTHEHLQPKPNPLPSFLRRRTLHQRHHDATRRSPVHLRKAYSPQVPRETVRKGVPTTL